jgi:hypothetical protein
MPTGLLEGLPGGQVCRRGSGITRRVLAWLEVVEEREKAVRRPVAPRAGAGLLDPGEGLLLDGHVGNGTVGYWNCLNTLSSDTARIGGECRSRLSSARCRTVAVPASRSRRGEA